MIAKYAHVLPASHPLSTRSKETVGNREKPKKRIVQLNEYFPDYVLNNLSQKHKSVLENFISHPQCAELVGNHYKNENTKQKDELFRVVSASHTVEEYVKHVKSDIEPQNRPYIPKYNTFKPKKNEDLHIEKQDEKFESANEVVPILRSRGLATEFHLRLKDDVQPFVTDERHKWESTTKLSHANDLILENYVNMDKWSEDQVRDMARQMYGENEKITLSKESVVDEVKCALRDIKNRMEEIVLVPEDDSAITAAKRAYFTYLRMVDSLLFSADKFNYHEQVIDSPAATEPPLSMELVGYLAQNYFLPWKIYTSEELEGIIFPWTIESLPTSRIESLRIAHENMYSTDKTAGLLAWGTSQAKKELIGIQIRKLEQTSGMDKRHTFYENEKRQFLERKEREEGRKLVNLLRKYAKQQNDKQRLFEFAKTLQQQYKYQNY